MTITGPIARGDIPLRLQYEHVLVPIDDSERSTIALRTGCALANRLGASVHACSVATDRSDLVHLCNVAAAALQIPSTDRRIHPIDGNNPAQGIATLADRLGSCIVCMSTHAHGRVTGSALGSTARELLHRRGSPVVMIGPFADRAMYFEDSWAPPLGVDRVVVCVEAEHPTRDHGDPLSPWSAAELVAMAAAWASGLGMSLTILNVAAPRASLSDKVDTDGLEASMTQLARNAATTGVDIDVHIETNPISTGNGVRSYLAAHPAGLLVVSTHARDGLDRLVHGTAAAGIIAASTIATLVIPIPHHSEPS